MNTLQVVPEIPVAREPVPWKIPLTAFVVAEEWFVAMSMHGVGLAFVA